jgi:hypothetical protein
VDEGLRSHSQVSNNLSWVGQATREGRDLLGVKNEKVKVKRRKEVFGRGDILLARNRREITADGATLSALFGEAKKL